MVAGAWTMKHAPTTAPSLIKWPWDIASWKTLSGNVVSLKSHGISTPLGILVSRPPSLLRWVYFLIRLKLFCQTNSLTMLSSVDLQWLFNSKNGHFSTDQKVLFVIIESHNELIWMYFGKICVVYSNFPGKSNIFNDFVGNFLRISKLFGVPKENSSLYVFHCIYRFCGQYKPPNCHFPSIICFMNLYCLTYLHIYIHV